MLFAIDIGNTNVHVGFFRGEEPVGFFTLGTEINRTSDEYELLLRSIVAHFGYSPADFHGGIIGSVAPLATASVRSALERLLGKPVITVGPGVRTGFPIKVDDPSELGADLAANTAGAIASVGAPVLVVDFGTATTLSAVNADGAYVGCSIMPGVRMSLDALRNTELLPCVADGASVPVLGKNSADSMRSGVIRGQALAVLGLLEAQKKALKLPSATPVLLTGGYAEAILPYLPASMQPVPALTLKGLCAIYHKNTDR